MIETSVEARCMVYRTLWKSFVTVTLAWKCKSTPLTSCQEPHWLIENESLKVIKSENHLEQRHFKDGGRQKGTVVNTSDFSAFAW